MNPTIPSSPPSQPLEPLGAIQQSWIQIGIASQQLMLHDPRQQAPFVAPVVTAAKGTGEQTGSLCTPRGWHRICEKIGAGANPGTVFVARVATGERYSSALAAQFPQRDWILTRILWLEGLEPGVNHGGEVDTRSRYIYIHGAPQPAIAARKGSKGCIQMYDADLIHLFDRVRVGMSVHLDESR